MHQPKILIVDDDENNRALLSDTLAGEHYTLLEAVNGNDALKVAEKETPDLILLDVLMAGLDGITTLRKLKEQEKTRHIPVIMVTALNLDTQIIDMSGRRRDRPYSQTLLQYRGPGQGASGAAGALVRFRDAIVYRAARKDIGLYRRERRSGHHDCRRERRFGLGQTRAFGRSRRVEFLPRHRGFTTRHGPHDQPGASAGVQRS